MDAVLYHIDQLDATELWEFFHASLLSFLKDMISPFRFQSWIRFFSVVSRKRGQFSFFAR